MKKHSKDAQEKKEFINAVAERMAKYYWNYNKGFEDGKNIGKTQALKDELKFLNLINVYKNSEHPLDIAVYKNIENRIKEIKSRLSNKKVGEE